MKKIYLVAFVILVFISCKQQVAPPPPQFSWIIELNTIMAQDAGAEKAAQDVTAEDLIGTWIFSYTDSKGRPVKTETTYKAGGVYALEAFDTHGEVWLTRGATFSVANKTITIKDARDLMKGSASSVLAFSKATNTIAKFNENKLTIGNKLKNGTTITNIFYRKK